jgi:hypothetical protein
MARLGVTRVSVKIVQFVGVVPEVVQAAVGCVQVVDQFPLTGPDHLDVGEFGVRHARRALGEQRAPLHPLGDGQAQQLENGGHQVDGLGDAGDALAGGHLAGRAQDQGHAHHLVVGISPLEQQPVIAQHLAVIGGEDHQRVVHVRVAAGVQRRAGGHALRALREVAFETQAFGSQPVQPGCADHRVARAAQAAGAVLVGGDQQHI